MLNYLLVWIVTLGSVGLYLSRFFLPEVQRKNDWIWSGIGLFYALILLADSDRIRGGLLLGQMASVSLIVWFGWQTLQQRRQLAPLQDQTALPDSVDSILPFAKTGLGRLVAAYKEGTLLDATDPSDSIEASKTTFKIGGFTVPSDLTKIFSLGSSPEVKETISAAAQPETQSVSPEIEEDWEEEMIAAADPLPTPEPAPEPVAEVSSAESAPTIDSPDPVEEPSHEPTIASEVEGNDSAIAAEEQAPDSETTIEQTASEVLTGEDTAANPHSEDHNNAVETVAEADPSSVPEERVTAPHEGGEDWPPEDPAT